MSPGDIREVVKSRAWGECYLCRLIYPLGDLRPVTTPNPADWRYICRSCAAVCRRHEQHR